MKKNQLLRSLARLPQASTFRGLTRVSPLGILGLARRRPRQPPWGWLALGGVVAAGAAALMAPSRRRSLVDLLHRTGGGLGKQFGKVVGGQVGAHPVGTARLVQGTRELVGSSVR